MSASGECSERFQKSFSAFLELMPAFTWFHNLLWSLTVCYSFCGSIITIGLQGVSFLRCLV